ncbi:branched-chain amino acid transport system II carrier protein [Spartinivicinus poritis]|uniref:Branched-chain amino acid transport system carrier protein n=1 Tax=Spartinivicinus poritis TaxID=2994640 RepID=A0ABT5U6Q9_9GAMM|nr:branched-chain amino acid transport system II carrier protein [Spartinivicinus sp. A2-2]MDE1462051.1 branched-chain amino acid transport system II carrier protein [Spartinivicinus sp. A2-2]
MNHNASFKTIDIIAIGLMTFALFLGAGNLILPPGLGYDAGAELTPVMIGFLLTGVGLPLLGIVATAKMNGGLPTITKHLHAKVAFIIGLVIYLSIGPLFAAPRTAVVAYEMSVIPLAELTTEPNQYLWLYSIVYFSAVLLISLFPGRLMDSIGKVITPLLVVVLVLIAAGTFLNPQGELQSTTQIEGSPFSKGFTEGYLTLDTLASLVFGIVIVNSLRQRGITDSKQLTKYTLAAGFIAAVGLSLVYISLAYLGATSHGLMAEKINGAQMIGVYINQIYGHWGQVILAIAITLACFTTAVGLMTSCGEYFHECWPQVSYRTFVIICTALTALVANVGLSQLMTLAIPALLAIYPVAIGLILLCFISDRLSNPRLVNSLTLLAIFCVSLFDGLNAAGIEAIKPVHDVYQQLPFASQGLTWLIPGIAGFLIAVALAKLSTSSRLAPTS